MPILPPRCHHGDLDVVDVVVEFSQLLFHAFHLVLFGSFDSPRDPVFRLRAWRGVWMKIVFPSRTFRTRKFTQTKTIFSSAAVSGAPVAKTRCDGSNLPTSARLRP